jgi:two-component system CitB family sensor kinase
MLHHLKLSTQILSLQVAIVLVTLLVVSGASVKSSGDQLQVQYGERALAVAQAVATLPTVRSAFDDLYPPTTLQPLAEAVREASGLTFVVIANSEGTRFSHPDPARIGERVSTDPGPALNGQDWIGVEEGTLGRSVRAKTPIFDDRGQVIGIVSVGILSEEVSAQLRRQLPTFLGAGALALALGVIGSLVLARRVKRQTHGLEPPEIGALLEQREAMLKSIREGTVGVDTSQRFTFANDEAARLLGLTSVPVGERVDAVVPPGRVRELLTRQIDGQDQIVLAGDHVLVANRMPVIVRGERVGSVVTLRDRTELEGLVRELATMRSLTDALRAQAHEFSNRLHTVAGLIELGHHEEAVSFITDTALTQQALTEALMERVGDPTIVALLLAKAASASEHGIELTLADDTRPDGELRDKEALVTILGNLIDNAIEAIGATGGRIEVALCPEGDDLTIRVADSGPGIPPDLVEEVFTDGYTTKVHGAGQSRGLGLALVRQAVARHEGSIDVTSDGGAVFTVTLPRVVRREAGVP